MSHRTAPHRGARGQATPLWAVVLVLAALALFPTGHLIRATRDRAEARTAADAAALAGALDGPDRAEEIATANGATLVDYRQAADEVEVTVVVGSRRATARAHREVTIRPGPAGRRPLAGRPG